MADCYCIDIISQSSIIYQRGGCMRALYIVSICGLLCRVFLMPDPLYAQVPDTLWTKIYGRSGPDHAYAVEPVNDGSYIVTGISFTASPICNYDIYLLKINMQGDTLWTKILGRTYNDGAYAIQQTFDDGYIIGGYSESGTASNEDIYLVKTDIHGDTLWSKTFGGTEDERGYCVKQTLDYGYIIVGDYTDNYREDIYIIKTDAWGDTVWTKRYGTQYEDFGRYVQSTADSGYIVVGHTDVEVGCQCFAVWLLKLNASGDTVWTHVYTRESYDDRACQVQLTNDGGYIIVGSALVSGNMWDVLLIKTDMYGDTLWKRTYGGPQYEYGYAVTQTYDNGYLVAGSQRPSSGNYSIQVWKIDPNGNTQWTTTYGGSENDEGRSVLQTPELNYLIAGYTESYGATNADVYLIMTRPDSFGIHEHYPGQSIHDALVSVYPNPSKDCFNIFYSGKRLRDETVQFKIYTCTGELVKTYNLQSEGGSLNSFQWDGIDNNGYNTPAGIYLLVCTSSEFCFCKKLILVR